MKFQFIKSNLLIGTVLTAPLLLSACGNSVYAFKNGVALPAGGCLDAFCEEVGNKVVGVVEKYQTGAEPADTTAGVRFFTVEEGANEDELIYRDGEETIVLTLVDFGLGGAIFEGDNGESALIIFEGDYVASFQWINDGGTAGAFGYAGAQTDPDLVPTEGAAFYSGNGFANLNDFDDVNWFSEADAMLQADFGGGTATLILDDFVSPHDAFDAIVYDNMDIDGYTFTGSEVALYDGLALVPTSDVVGANDTTESGGVFFGYDDFEEVPAEFGAVGSTAGDDGILSSFGSGSLLLP